MNICRFYRVINPCYVQTLVNNIQTRQATVIKVFMSNSQPRLEVGMVYYGGLAALFGVPKVHI